MSAKVLARVHLEADTKAGFDLQVLLEGTSVKEKGKKTGARRGGLHTTMQV